MAGASREYRRPCAQHPHSMTSPSQNQALLASEGILLDACEQGLQLRAIDLDRWGTIDRGRQVDAGLVHPLVEDVVASSACLQDIQDSPKMGLVEVRLDPDRDSRSLQLDSTARRSLCCNEFDELNEGRSCSLD